MDEPRFDEVIHAPLRLRICGLLHPVDRLDFGVLRTALDVSDATLSKHVKTLAESGYVLADKTTKAERGDARRVMWLSLSRAGRAAFDAHVRALQQIAGTAGR
ncbi:transcriptional regulator [Arthrobacter sp. Sa2BUA2]|uniref:Transcriptional regulator n=1 Tax=Arthrobacter pullicola TaxID=2762224 RepID=A0ABR8YM23_9MICC|nr:transcriptional regulator [Arthrobacter pullicola]MBD8045292.1 transcriptional regulator [Arthrobacter pullicola]